MSFSSRSNHRRENPEKQDPSRVLLICIYDTIALEITNQIIYEKFSKYGPIVKVLIFEKGQVTKLFLEFSNQDDAQQAKIALDGTKLLGSICKMNIYFSNFHNVDLKNETSEGADFSRQEEMKNEYSQKFDKLSRSFQSDTQEYQQFMFESAFSTFPARSKTDNPLRMQQQINKVNKYEPPSMISEEEEIQQIIHNGIYNIIDSRSNYSSDNPKPNSTLESTARIVPGLKIKGNSPTKSSILAFPVTNEISIKCLYNLFSNFGNLSFISLKHKRVFLKFRTLQFAAIATNYLQDYSFMGNVLKLQTLQNPQQAFPRENQYCQCVFYDESYDRFTPQRSLTVNSPSQTLHVSSLKKETCREMTLHKIFGEYGKVQAVRILCYSNEKNMALVKFYNIEDSFYAIANLHNENFAGRKIQISFTKSRV